MKRLWVVSQAIIMLFIFSGTGHAEETLDIGQALKPGFAEIALLPTRLTYYNMHEDAAIASYTCCKPWQEEEIRKAIAANGAFLENYYDTDYADDTLLHNAYINRLRRNFRHQVGNLVELVDRFPDSDFADDALYKLGQCYISDKDHQAAINTLERLVREWPRSVWADDALMFLASEYRTVENQDAAIEVFDLLAYEHPSSDHAPRALDALATRAMEDEDYEEAIAISRHILNEYNCSDYADDAQFRVAEALRHMAQWRDALDAYLDLIDRLPGSALSNRAMREANSIARQAAAAGNDIAPVLFNTIAANPGREAQELYDLARHFQNYREYSSAISTYERFIDTYPGNDNYDDALYNIGVCYQQTNILFQDINKANGPEDILKFSGEYQDATGAYGSLPTAGDLSAVRDATSAFALVVNNLVGSPLRDDALYEVAKSFEDSERWEDMAYTYQELVINFPGSDYHYEALYEMLKFYADAKNWDAAQYAYPALSRAYPAQFPSWLITNKIDFYTVIGTYYQHADFAWMETHKHHIPYRYTIHDVMFDADFIQGALCISGGEYEEAIDLLRPLAKMDTNDLCVPAAWMVARTYELQGKTEAARNAYRYIISRYPRSGLADDAQLAIENIDSGGEKLSKYRERVSEKVGFSVDNFDWYLGENVIVFAPFTVSAKLRQYNMPNIWENAQAVLCDWTGAEFDEPVLICVDPNNRPTNGQVIRLPARQVKDPPQWSLGLKQLSEATIARAAGDKLAGTGWAVDGLASFAAASLQYDLVTETRDAIGSATAVKLPQEEVVRTRERALEKLAEYVRTGEARNLNGDVFCGMLFQLLDVQGYSKSRLVDREPYQYLFACLNAQPGNGIQALSGALDYNFRGEVNEQLRMWKLPVRNRVSQKPAR